MSDFGLAASNKPTPIRLYKQSRNPSSERVAAGLAVKGLEFERVISYDPDDVARSSPIARTLPVLEIAGRRKTDSAVILEWLDELAPDPPMLSAVTKTAAVQKQPAEWSNDSFTFYYRNRWRAARYPQPGDDQPVDDSLIAKVLDRVGRSLGRQPRTRAEARELEIVSQLFDRMTDLEGFLGERTFFIRGRAVGRGHLDLRDAASPAGRPHPRLRRISRRTPHAGVLRRANGGADRRGPESRRLGVES